MQRLPDVRLLNIHPFVNQQYQEYFERKEIANLHFAIKPQNAAVFLEQVEVICQAFNFNARQIQHLFRTLSHHLLNHENTNSGLMSWVCASAFMAALNHYDEAMYHKLGLGKFNADELYNWLNAIGKNQPRSEDFTALWESTIEEVFAFSLTSENTDSFAVSLYLNTKEKSVSTPEERIRLDEFKQRLIRLPEEGRISRGRMKKTSIFNDIYNSLEEWRTFFEQ